MAQQRLQRPSDPASLEDLRKLRSSSGSPDGGSSSKDDRARVDDGQREADSPDGSIEVDDRNDEDPKVEEDDSPRISSSDLDENDDFREQMDTRLRPSMGNLKDLDISGDEQVTRRGDLTVKIRLEGTVDLSTKRGQDKENVGQDLTTRRKDDDVEVDRELSRPRKDRSPKPRHVWRPY